MKIICCDWGTSALRLRLVDAFNFNVVAQDSSRQGVAQVFEMWKKEQPQRDDREGYYLSHIRKRVQRFEGAYPDMQENTPVIISGMASSSLGIRELPYASLPFSLSGEHAIVHKLEHPPLSNHGIFLLSGVRHEREVMRGEETQLIGVREILSGQNLLNNTIVILPGTHSKHIRIVGNAITGMETYVTGELFGLLTSNGLTGQAVRKPEEEAPDCWTYFEEGVAESGRCSLLHSLFSIRTNHLLGKYTREQNYFFLSGLLIGHELRNLQHHTIDLVLCSETNLYPYYRFAMDSLGMRSHTFYIDPAEAELAMVKGQIQTLQNQLCL